MKKYVEIVVKDYGVMTVELSGEAEHTIQNFLNYVDKKAYDGTIFHRVIKNFMIQGGAVKHPDQPIVGEFLSNGFKNSRLHKRGVISMARTSDKNSQTSQFFIMHKDAPHLDGQYASFGILVDGFDCLDAIANKPCDAYDKPLKDVVITSIRVKHESK